MTSYDHDLTSARWVNFFTSIFQHLKLKFQNLAHLYDICIYIYKAWQLRISWNKIYDGVDHMTFYNHVFTKWKLKTRVLGAKELCPSKFEVKWITSDWPLLTSNYSFLYISKESLAHMYKDITSDKFYAGLTIIWHNLRNEVGKWT